MGLTFNDISIAVEFSGFTLTYLELFRPQLADRVEDFIDSTYDTLKKVVASLFVLVKDVDLIVGHIFALICFIGTAVFYYYYDGEAVKFIFLIDIVFVPLVLLAILFTYYINLLKFYFALIAILPVFGLHKLIEFLNYMSGGRAIGSMGFIFATIGLIIETYQYF